MDPLPALKAPTTNGRTPSANSNNAIRNANTQTEQDEKHIWVITGPAGCGKTSVAEHLHDVFGLPYLEGDAFHTPTNVAKMRDGHPLTDADRWDWLADLRDQALRTLFTPTSPSNPDQTPTGVLLTCSALRRPYRKILRSAASHLPPSAPATKVRVHFIYLAITEKVVLDRVAARQGHYMKADMVRSQFESLEVPENGEVVGTGSGDGEEGREGDVFVVDSCGEREEVWRGAKGAVEGVMGKVAQT